MKNIKKCRQVIGMLEYSDSTGVPLVYFHWFPGSRLDEKLSGYDEIRL